MLTSWCLYLLHTRAVSRLHSCVLTIDTRVQHSLVVYLGVSVHMDTYNYNLKSLCHTLLANMDLKYSINFKLSKGGTPEIRRVVAECS